LLSVFWTRAQSRASFGVALAILGLFAVSHASAAVQQPLSRDVDCLAAAVYYEARGESAAGQAAVAQVVLNRARKAGFPKSVCGVIYQSAHGRGCQFSFVCSGVMNHPRDATAWNSARKVAARALNGYVMTEVGAATSFHAVRLGSGPDAHMSRIARVGAHVFLVDAPRDERPSSAPDVPETRKATTLASS
jgi:spore germination cell wall hydrolase CwlJ-like protein